MAVPSQARTDRIPWYLWPLAVVVIPIGLVAMLPIAFLAVLSIPYFTLYPDRHAQLSDFEGHGSPRRRELIAKWRSGYRRLGLSGRVARAYKVWRRRRADPVRGAVDESRRPTR